MTTDQKKIIDKLRELGGEITKQEVVGLIGKRYYCNASKHVGEILSRMVKSRLLKRIKPGVFRKGEKVKSESIVVNPLQTQLF